MSGNTTSTTSSGAISPDLERKWRVLLVDDEDLLRDVIKDLLQINGYEVLEGNNGQAGLDLLKQDPSISLVVSDIRMPVMDGVKFFQEAQKVRKIPFLMMTAFSELMDIDKAYAMGVSEFISKPFTNEELISCLELLKHEILGTHDATKAKTPDFDYCRVHVDDFLAGSAVQSDIFLRLAEDKYLRVAKTGSPLSSDRVTSYKKKGLMYFYIKKEDFAKYVGMSVTISQAINKGKTIPKHRKMAVLRNTLDSVMQDIYVNGIDRVRYATAKDLVESTLNLILENNDMFSILEMLSQHRDKTYAHSIGVSIYSVAVAHQWGWTSSPALFKLALAGLLHDIGKKEIPLEILEKPRHLMSTEEILLYESHTVRGQEILNQVPGIPQEVVACAVQHHENMAGRGYPYRITRMRIHPVAKLVGGVDEFCKLVLKAEGQGLPPKEALDIIYQQKMEEIDPHVVRALMELSKIQLPEDLANMAHVKAIA